MPATTPYEQVDYQQISAYRPYQLPVNDIFKAVAAQSQYWDEGAYKVKSVYDSALNLSLSKEENKKIRDQYVKDSEQLLAKLSTMNLADPSVQRQGVNIYKPLFQDRGIISDHAATEQIKKIQADAERARTEDHGKYYSQYNHQYALYGAKEFMDSADRNAGEAYLKTARNYEDYYDYTEEYKKALDLCPEDSSSTKLPYYGPSGKSMTGYMKFEEIKERTVSKAYNCLLSNLSGQAKRQLQIEGSVTYRSKKIEDFAEEVRDSYKDQNDLYKKQRAQILADMASINSKDKKLTDQEKLDAYGKMDLQAQNISKSILENEAKIEKLNKGDLTEIYENFDSHAANLYVQKTLYKEAVGMAFRKYSLAYEGDPVQMLKIRQSFEDMMQNKRFSHDFSLKAMDQAFAIKMKQIDVFFKNPWNQAAFTIDDQGNIVANPNVSFLNQNLYTKPGDQTPGSEVYKDLKLKAEEANKTLSQANANLFNNIITKAEQHTQTRDALLKAYGYTDLNQLKNDVKKNGYQIDGVKFADTEFMKRYLQTNKSVDFVNAYNASTAAVKLKLESVEGTLGIQEKEVLKRLGASNVDEYVFKKLENSKDKLKIENTQFTANEMLSLKNGRVLIKDGNEYKMEIKPLSASEVLGAGMGSSLPYQYDYSVYKNGKRLPGKNVPNFNAIFEEADIQVNKIRDDVYRNMGANINQTRFIRSYDNQSPMVEQLQSGLADSEGKPNKNISVIGFSGNGDIIVNIPNAGENTAETITKLGIGESAEAVEGTSNFIIKGTNYGIINQPINNPMIREIATTLGTVNYTNAHSQADVGEIVTSYTIPIWNNVAGVSMTTRLDVIKESPNMEGSPNSRYQLWMIDETGNINSDAPLIDAQSSLEFMNDYTNLPLRFSKPAR